MANSLPPKTIKNIFKNQNLLRIFFGENQNPENHRCSICGDITQKDNVIVYPRNFDDNGKPIKRSSELKRISLCENCFNKFKR